MSLVVLMVFSGAAYAYWGSSGNGGGSGTTGTSEAVILSPGSPTAQLRPGGRANVVLDISNPNTSPVEIASLVLDTSQGVGGYGVDAGHSDCTPGSLDFTSQTNGGAGWTVPGRAGAVNGTRAVSLTDAIFMQLNAANACQGAHFTVYLKAGP
jgi:hypothetical protein